MGAHWLEQLNRYSCEIASQLALPHVRRVAVSRATELCGADGASLFLLDPETGRLNFEVVDGGAGEVLEQRSLAPGEGIAGRVAVEGVPLLVADVNTSRDHAYVFDRATGFITASIIAVPLNFGDSLLGVLECVRSTSMPPFTQEELEHLEAFAPHVAAAVQHLRTEESLRDARESLQRNNEDLERRVADRTRLIAQGKKEWESTFDAIRDPTVVLEGYTVRRANKAFQEASGKRAWHELIGRPCYEVFAGRKLPCVACPMAGGNKLSQVQVGGRTYSASRSLAEIGGAPASVVQYRDLTEQASLEERLRESERLASIGQLASGAAHEINNPLSFVLTNIRLLRDSLIGEMLPATHFVAEARDALARGDAKAVIEKLKALDLDLGQTPEIVEVVDEALLGAARIGDIVKSLRELSRQEQGRVEATSVDGVVQRALNRALGPSTRASVSLASRSKVMVVPLQLERAIENVIKNARQATTSDEGVTIRTRDTEDSTIIEVEDRGSGIAPEHVSRIFEPFFTTRRLGEGQGLGLTVTWGIIKRLGGRIDVKSEVGKGTTVSLVLPAGAAAVSSDSFIGVPELQSGRYAERPSGVYAMPPPPTH